ncbi:MULTISPECIES: hypothetical protein [Thalassospira]|uniref:Uncharacterized protein n=1 Tax=Thalassospira profundimaris TaxID=502049 RepID=A0A367V364_9PROT|nr:MULTISPECIES: hypothetical protein [Thalassospira]KZB72671.1 hypothetical protein AUQ43_00900 [Thalassospira sp. MCCC 1A01148]MBR9899855.1 hypothetical protein [Rhodospirillales bacterium]RCK19638.1 hypothetical protein TH6_18740 [Thalassospira profundimaris]
MGSWIEQHATLLQVGVSIATLMIWIFYAQLLFQSYRRVRRPKIVINQMLGSSDKARFLISNMSQEAIHIDKVLVCVGEGQHQICEQVTDADPEQFVKERDPNQSPLSARLEEVTLQGPLEPGGCIELGALQNLLGRIERRSQLSRDAQNDQQDSLSRSDQQRIEIMVIGVYSSEKGVIGASRAFVCEQDGNLHPEAVQTTQHAGFFERRRMARLHAQYV